MTRDEMKAVLAYCSGTPESEFSEFSWTETFAELGFDSLLLLAVQAELQSKHEISIPDEVASTLETPEDLLRIANEVGERT